MFSTLCWSYIATLEGPLHLSFFFPVHSSALLPISKALFPLLFVSSFCRKNANIPTTQGFDEFMNVVLDEAAEVYVKEAKPRRELGV